MENEDLLKMIRLVSETNDLNLHILGIKLDIIGYFLKFLSAIGFFGLIILCLILLSI